VIRPYEGPALCDNVTFSFAHVSPRIGAFTSLLCNDLKQSSDLGQPSASGLAECVLQCASSSRTHSAMLLITPNPLATAPHHGESASKASIHLKNILRTPSWSRTPLHFDALSEESRTCLRLINQTVLRIRAYTAVVVTHPPRSRRFCYADIGAWREETWFRRREYSSWPRRRINLPLGPGFSLEESLVLATSHSRRGLG